ncbi:MAG: glycosyltransferase family 9 protein, partial [Bacteroidia bacterium]
CGSLTLNQSASVIKQSSLVITSDTGLMHMAAAFNKRIISVWGNTIPEFGMSPYMPNPDNQIMEVKGLSCRPCSKLGYNKCPRGHFKCMNDIEVEAMRL